MGLLILVISLSSFKNQVSLETRTNYTRRSELLNLRMANARVRHSAGRATSDSASDGETLLYAYLDQSIREEAGDRGHVATCRLRGSWEFDVGAGFSPRSKSERSHLNSKQTVSITQQLIAHKRAVRRWQAVKVEIAKGLVVGIEIVILMILLLG